MRINISKISCLLLGFIFITAPFYRINIGRLQILDIDIVFGVCLLLITAMQHKISVYRNKASVSLLLFMLYALLSSMWSPSTSYSGWLYTIKILLIAVVVYFTVLTLEKEWLKRMFVISGVVIFVLLLTQGGYYFGGIRYTILVGNSYIDPNVLFPLYILPNTMMMEYFIAGDGKFYKKIFYIVFALISVLYIFLSGSRSALLAVILSVVIYCLFHIKSPKTIALLVVAVIGLLIVANKYIPDDVISRFAYSSLEETEGAGRLEIWKNVINELGNTSTTRLLCGNGINSAKLILGKTTHNMFLEIVFEYGLIGLGLFCTFLVTLFTTFIKTKDLLNVAVFIAFLFMSMTVAMNNMLIFWMYFLYFYLSYFRDRFSLQEVE